MKESTFFLVIGILLFLMIAFGVWKIIDWREFFVKKYGENYHHGTAYVKVLNKWKFEYSELVYEGNDAKTYRRNTIIDGKAVKYYDIVPNSIGYDYSVSTGRRIYKIMDGKAVAFCGVDDKGVADYPAELVSMHVMDRTMIAYAKSVTADAVLSWKVILIAVIGIIAIVVCLKLTGVIKTSKPVTTTGKPGVVQTTNSMPSGTTPLPVGQ
jgi:hypothetical protein